MLWVPQKGIVQVQHNAGEVGDVTIGAAVTTGATSPVKGTPVEIFASTSFDAYRIIIFARRYGLAATASDACLDILTGAATEEVLIPNLLAGCSGDPAVNASERVGRSWDFPLYIPAGSRIAAQAAGDRVSTAMDVAVYLYGGHGIPPWRVGSKITTYGIGTVPDATTIVAGATGAEGAWTQIVASTSEAHFALFPGFSFNSDTSTSSRCVQVDIGHGAATEEEVVNGSGWMFLNDNAEMMSGPWPCVPAFQDVPSGTRLTMRASCSGTADTYMGAIHAVS